MSFSKQSILLALVLLTRSYEALANGGPRGQVSNRVHRALQVPSLPLRIVVRGKPGALTDDHLRILETVFIQTYNTEQDCDARVENVSFEKPGAYAGTGLASKSFPLEGFVTLVPGPSLFPSMVVSTVPISSKGKMNKGMMSKGKMSKGKMSKGKMSKSVQKGCSLTKETFVMALDLAIQAVSNDTFDFSIQNVTDVTELESTDTVAGCSSQNEFTSTVLVTFSGDPTVATESQLLQLSQSFLETYNSANNINPEKCDPLFREVSSVSLVAGRRKLEGNEHAGVRALASQFSYRYNVQSNCRNCGNNTRLFGEGSGRRQLADIDRSLQTSTCLCPVNATELRATTTDEFAAAYGVSIVVLQEEDVVDETFIESVLGVVEINCEADEAFEMQVSVKFNGSCSVGTEVLEQQFSSAYLKVAETFCDPYFRNITQVDIESSISGPVSCKFDFNVKGWCHGGCEGNPNLFSAGVSSCFCAVDSIENRAPTIDEFKVAFDETVENLNIVEIYTM